MHFMNATTHTHTHTKYIPEGIKCASREADFDGLILLWVAQDVEGVGVVVPIEEHLHGVTVLEHESFEFLSELRFPGSRVRVPDDDDLLVRSTGLLQYVCSPRHLRSDVCVVDQQLPVSQAEVVGVQTDQSQAWSHAGSVEATVVVCSLFTFIENNVYIMFTLEKFPEASVHTHIHTHMHTSASPGKYICLAVDLYSHLGV
jgi:hypothetical protein